MELEVSNRSKAKRQSRITSQQSLLEDPCCLTIAHFLNL